MTGRISAAIFLFAALAGACQSTAVPAVLTQADEAAMGRLRAALAKAMGQAEVQLGPGDPSQTSVVSVLPLPPGPLEDRSLAKPTIFRLEIEGETCVLVREDTGARVTLEGVDCRPAAP
ncbi:MAG: hypothetical protein Q8R02_15970 [Hyphomonadaceae bacterium]|nr:hypothetical protein [Hyphomonadaceae bacterium]